MGAVSPAREESKLAATIAELETMLETTLETREGLHCLLKSVGPSDCNRVQKQI